MQRHTMENVKEKVSEFIRREFPEIKSEVEEAHLADEIANILYDMLVGDYQEDGEEA